MSRWWSDVWALAVAKAWQDEHFKAKLLKDPKETLRTTFGVELPEGIGFKVVEGQAAQAEVTFVLPPKPQQLDEGLAELTKLLQANVKCLDLCGC
jgi:hypothetical protein